MDLFLLFFAVVGMVVFLIINAKMVLYYEESSPGDTSESSFIRGTVVASWTLAYVVIFLLPIDVRNARQQGGLDMETFWQIAVTTVILFVGFLLPAAIFFIETKGDNAVFEKGSAARRTFGQMIFFFFFVLMFLLISFAFLSTAKLPVVDVACGNWIDADAVIESQHICQSPVDRFLEISVRFDIYVMAVFCFVGWWLFVVFGGVGLTALPMDLVMEYLDRPKPISVSVYASKKILYAQTADALLSRAQDLQERDAELKDKAGRNIFVPASSPVLILMVRTLVVLLVGHCSSCEVEQPIMSSSCCSRRSLLVLIMLVLLCTSDVSCFHRRAAGPHERLFSISAPGGWSDRRKIRALKTDFNRFKQSVTLLEKEFDHMEACRKQRGENPLVSFGRMVLAGIFGLASLFWVLHIFLYLLLTEPGESEQPAATFLNGILIGFEDAGLFVLAAVRRSCLGKISRSFPFRLVLLLVDHVFHT